MAPPSVMQAPLWAQPSRLLAVAIAVLVAVALMPAPLAMPPVFPLGDQPVYSALDAPHMVLLEPVLHAPWVGGSPRAVALLVSGTALAAAAVLAAAIGAAPLATATMLLALASNASFAATASHAGWLAIATALMWLAMALAFERIPATASSQSPAAPAWRTCAMVLVWGLALSWSWLAIVIAPMMIAAAWRGRRWAGRLTWLVGIAVLAAVAVVWHFERVATVAEAAAFAPGVALGWRGAMEVAFDWRSAAGAATFAAPAAGPVVPLLAVALGMIGVVVASLPRWSRRSLLGAALCAGAVVMVWPVWQTHTGRLLGWTTLPLAAAGLTWISQRIATATARRVAVVALGAIVMAVSVVTGARPLAGAEAQQFGVALTGALQTVAGPPVMVAEDTRLDSALAAWSAGGRRGSRMVQDGATAMAAFAAGRSVLAGPTGRRHIELGGVQLRERLVIQEPARFALSEVVGTFRCAAVRQDRWSRLAGVEYTGRLGLEIPPGLGAEMRLIVGDDLPLQLSAFLPDGQSVPFGLTTLLNGPGANTPPADFWLDQQSPNDSPERVARATFPAHASATTMVAFHMGRRAPRVLARLSGYDTQAHGRVCAAPIGLDAYFDRDARTTPAGAGDARGGRVVVVPLRTTDLFGAGWFGLEGRGADAFRWGSGDAAILVPSARGGAVRVAIVASPAAAVDRDGPDLQLSVNGLVQGTQRMRRGPNGYEWQVPAGAWLAGTNELLLHVSRTVRPADSGGRDTRILGLILHRLALTMDEP